MIKLYPVVDYNDVFKYNVGNKKSLHISNDLYHRSSHVFIEVFGRRFIIQKKSKLAENGGLWSSSVSGHVEAGESYRTAAKREVKEELGLDVNINELENILKIGPGYFVDTGREFVTLFTYLLDPRTERVTVNREELDGIAVMPLNDLKDDIKANKDRYSPVFVLLFDMFLSLKRGT